MAYSKYADLELLDYPDCISLNDSGKCSLLPNIHCMRGGCVFLRTYDEMRRSQRRTEKRLSSLDAETQRRIAAKYYGGRMPWRRP